jgi:hypothetical protein
MKYVDLIQFEPVETTIKLLHADEEARARQLVATYVISDEMAMRLVGVVFPQLQFRRPADNKGLLVVGNYGTGKSHLMSVLSAIAEYPELVREVKNAQVREAAQEMAGQFKVVRTEIGAVTMSLRDIIVTELEEHLAEMGVYYTFPAASEITNNFVALEEMMAAFHEQYPDKGLLLVVDELLDYLRTRKLQELILDLGFLREVGEASKDLRFRFVAGVQETLFDSPTFSFVANQLRRVKDRFEQILIVRRDVQFVVAERLLKKNAEQQAQIRDYLLPFARFYDEMNERMDEFVRLFPVHPDYIRTFERVTVVEKREILKTLSFAMRQLIDERVPNERPGLLCYDGYWKMLKENPSYRAIPDVAEVVRVSENLENRVRQAFTRPAYRPMALRLIHGLSIHRLTTGDIDLPIGATAQELRDALVLFDPMVAEMGDEPAEDMLWHVKTVLREIHRTVNGQFISRTEESEQYYLDLKKDIDYEALIETRANALDKNALDLAYFDALAQILERTDTYYPGTHLAWKYELLWPGRNVERQGYLFFGTPNQRATAQPERDFYIYFVQPYDPPALMDAPRADELFFRLVKQDKKFEESLKFYAAATELAKNASGNAKRTYESKAKGYLKELVKWLERQMSSAFEVTWRGQSNTLPMWLKGQRRLSARSRANVRDLVDGVASLCFSEHFESLAPEYPHFSVEITQKNRLQAAADALRWMKMKGTTGTRQGAAVLDGLELLDGERLVPHRSRYATYLLTLMQRKGMGQVLNRREIFQTVQGSEYMAPDLYRLEEEWVVVLLAALVYNGDVVLTIPGHKFDATKLDELVSTSMRKLAAFKHVERPKEWNLPALRALFELMQQPPGLAQSVTQGKNEAVAQLQGALAQQVEKLVRTQQTLQEGFTFWGRSLLDQQEERRYRQQLSEAKRFMESLQPYNSAAKLKNLRYGSADVQAQEANFAPLRELSSLQELLTSTAPLANYLAQAELTLPGDHPWVERAQTMQKEVSELVRTHARQPQMGTRQRISAPLKDLKRDYITLYMGLHNQARLGLNEDRHKAKLLVDVRLGQLRQLATIELMPASQLTDYQNRLVGLQSCFALTEQELQRTPVCPHCRFKPINEKVMVPASEQLAALEVQIVQILAKWTETLLDNLQDPITQQNLNLLRPRTRQRVEKFLTSGQLPHEVNHLFVQSLREALSGLTKVVITIDAIKRALLEGGLPVTAEELKQRFAGYVDEQIKGKQRDKVRLVLE